MIIRIFVSPCNLEGMEEFYLSKALPILRKQEGCLLAIAAKDKNSRPPKIAMISVWKNLSSLERFTGRNYKKPKVVPEEKPLLLGKPLLQNLEAIRGVKKKDLRSLDQIML
ncbi:MAG: hypothetical protein M1368_04725 [Thaumarchaeota archaeon]|nr:hypothetical protein [Nitrososphaerota archaeon]